MKPTNTIIYLTKSLLDNSLLPQWLETAQDEVVTEHFIELDINNRLELANIEILLGKFEDVLREEIEDGCHVDYDGVVDSVEEVTANLSADIRNYIRSNYGGFLISTEADPRGYRTNRPQVAFSLYCIENKEVTVIENNGGLWYAHLNGTLMQTNSLVTTPFYIDLGEMKIQRCKITSLYPIKDEEMKKLKREHSFA